MCWFSFVRARWKFNIYPGIAILVAVNLLAPSASGQRVSLGVVVGGYGNTDFYSRYVPTPGFLPTVVQSDAGGYVAGPSLDVRLFPRLSLNVEAIYKALGYRTGATFTQHGQVIGFDHTTVVTWQFPVPAKYKVALGRVRPFVEGGPSFRYAPGLRHFGVSAGIGVETQWRRLRVAPRLRYTRWAKDRPFAVQARPDQLEALVGFSYAAASDAYPLGRRVSLGAALVSTVSADTRTTTETWLHPLTGARWTSHGSSGPRGVVVSPLIELSLSPRFSIEGNAISRSFRHVSRTTIVNPDSTTQVLTLSASGGNTWQFPVLVKYRFSKGSVRPFFALGPSFRLPKEIGAWLSSYGATAGVGAEIPWKRIRIAPAVRYTRWGPERPRVAGGLADSGVPRNQLEVLVAFSF
jgi:hypothetical protein